MRKESFLSWIFKFINIWVIFGAVLVFVLLAVFWGTILWAFSPIGPKVIAPTAEITIIPAPTLTMVIVSTPTSTPVPQVEDTAVVDLLLGSMVEITGTGSDGLRIRSDPGTGGTILFVAKDGERFIVKDGPQEADGYTWYYLVSDDDKSKAGWGAMDYIRVIDN